MKRIHTTHAELFHFTLPCRLPRIFSTGGLEPSATVQHGFMSGGVPVVWLTTDPHGNEIDRATIRHFRKLKLDDLLAEIENGRRLMFGADKADGDGSARIALHLPKQAQRDGAVVPYLNWVRAEMGAEVWRRLRSRLSSHAEDWWISFAAIPVELFKDVTPVGEPSPGYTAAVKTISKSKRRRRKTVPRKNRAAAHDAREVTA
jgi:hypothetical protein